LRSAQNARSIRIVIPSPRVGGDTASCPDRQAEARRVASHHVTHNAHAEMRKHRGRYAENPDRVQR